MLELLDSIQDGSGIQGFMAIPGFLPTGFSGAHLGSVSTLRITSTVAGSSTAEVAMAVVDMLLGIAEYLLSVGTQSVPLAVAVGLVAEALMAEAAATGREVHR